MAIPSSPKSRNREDEPLVSVCLPTFNDGSFLHESLCSIVNQTYRHLEILVGDDHSTDNTREIVQTIQDPRIHYHRNERNLGQFPNVNALIERAQGKYVAIYHSDDIYHPEIIAREVAYLEAEPRVGAVFALDWRINARGETIGKMKLLPEIPARTPLSLPDIMPILLRHRNRVFRAPTFMGRREIFREVGLFSSEFSIAGDFEMWLRILTRYPVAILDEWLMGYRRGDSQVSHSYQNLRTFEEHFFHLMDQYLKISGLHNSIGRIPRTEYAFHRIDDETFRAANLIIKGELSAARALLQHPFPWQTMGISTVDLHWRKIRVLLLRILMRVGLTINLAKPLGRLLAWIEYRDNY